MKTNYLKMLVLVFVIGLFVNTLFAQGAYVNINAGYGLKMSSQNISNFSNTSTSGSNSTTYEQLNISLGKGLNVGGTFGYMFNKNLGAELGISYLFGSKSKAKETYSGGSSDYTISSNMLRINPSLVISSGLDKFNPYLKLGLLIGTGSIKFEQNSNDDGGTQLIKMKLNGGIAFGLTSGLGALYNLSDKMSLFGELNMINLSYAPTKGEITEYTQDGADLLPNMTTRDKKTEYVDSYTYDPSNPPSASEPSKELKEKLPFGSFGINIGVRIKL